MDAVNVMNFILNHPKRERVFKGYNFADIFSSITECLTHGGLMVMNSSEGNAIAGIFGGIPNPLNKHLHIKFMLVNTKEKNVVRNMLRYLNNIFPDYTITAYRRERLKTYNNRTRLLKHLSHLSY